jgi:hypothetical protein
MRGDQSTLADKLAELSLLLVRRLEPSAELAHAAQSLAQQLIRTTEGVTPDNHLILGGSLARGEPIFVRGRENELASDIDLLLVHEALLPPFAVKDFIARAQPALPTLTLMTLSMTEYQRLRTSIGFEFKDAGYSLNHRRVPAHAAVEVTTRDAFEVFIFGIFLYFMESLGQRWLSEEDSLGFRYALSRACVKMIRAGGMPLGAYSGHDLEQMRPDLADHMARELTWQRDPVGVSLPPQRFWCIARDVLANFDVVHGQARNDSIVDSEYEHAPGADVVAYHQGIAMRIARAVLAAGDPEALTAAKTAALIRHAWAEVVRDGLVRPLFSPEEFFHLHAGTIRENLLALKVSPIGGQ